MDSLRQDLSYAVRLLARNPGFTAVAVLTLALGIGATTAIFTVVNGVLLRSLPYPNPDRIVRVYETNPKLQNRLPLISPSVPNYLDWKEQNTVFEHMAAYRFRSFTFTGGQEPERIGGAAVPANLFALLGVEPALGRAFRPEEERPGQNHVIVLSFGFWQGRFGGDSDALGQTLQLNDRSYTIVGVLPSTLGPPFTRTRIFVPWVAEEDRNYLHRGARELLVIARVRQNVSLEQAGAEMNTIARRLAEAYPDSNKDFGVRLVPLHEMTVRYVRTTLLILLGAVGFVLLIACANVANLLLVRATVREREMAVRAALGAGRGRLVRQLLTESLLLSSLGSALGLLLALGGVRLLVSLRPPGIPRLGEVGLDGNVLLFALGTALLTGAVFGVAPALSASNPSLADALKQAGTTSGTRGRRWLRSLLVVAEVALALVLLVGAGLLIRSFFLLQQVDLGFNPDNLLTMQVWLSKTKYAEGHERNQFYRRLTERIESLPAVQGVATATSLPLGGGYAMTVMVPGDQRPVDSQEWREADFLYVGPNYFCVLGVAILQGRSFTEKDRDDAPKVVIIGDTLARRYWLEESPLGKHLLLAFEKAPREIVGVVRDVRYGGLNTDFRLKMYIPYAQPYGRAYAQTMSFVLRTATNPLPLSATLKSVVWSLDADVPVVSLKTMKQHFSRWLVRPRFYMLLFGIFAVLAAALAFVGIYGVISYSVSQRTHEIGIRMALGAQRGDILKLVVGQGMMLVLIGVVVGLAGAIALTRFLASFLFEVAPTDPLTFVAITFLLAAVALVAVYVPARRATKVDPMVALRYE
jgi:putative ABC transport system permease protein